MTVKEQIALDRALKFLKIGLTFTGHALSQLPEEERALRLSIMDARDVLAVAVDAVEERAKK